MLQRRLALSIFIDSSSRYSVVYHVLWRNFSDEQVHPRSFEAAQNANAHIFDYLVRQLANCVGGSVVKVV